MIQKFTDEAPTSTGFAIPYTCTLPSALMLAALSSSSVAEHSHPRITYPELLSSESSPLQDIDDFLCVDTTLVCLPEKPVEKVCAVLAYCGLTADSVTEMPEGSHLFDFNQTIEAWIEVDSSKDIVVVVKDGEFRDLYEFTTDNIHLLPEILNNANVRGRL